MFQRIFHSFTYPTTSLTSHFINLIYNFKYETFFKDKIKNNSLDCF